MDQKKLLEKISKSCLWVYPSVAKNGSGAERTVPVTPNVAYTQEFEMTTQLGPRIIGLKENDNLNVCDWCGKIANQVTLHRMTFRNDQRTGWQHECRTCDRLYDPKTRTLTKKKPRGSK